MTRNVLTIFIIKIKCEKIFNIAKVDYDYRKRYNSNIFFVLMLMRFFEQKKYSRKIKR